MKISVVIPCYNAEAHIEKCLDSVLQQTHRDLEIICVNDGSQDHTADIIRDYMKKTGALQLVDQANCGAGKARNAGLTKASGAYIQFLDADDKLKSSKLQHQAGLIGKADEEPDFIAADFILVQENGIKKAVHMHEKRPFHALLSKNLGVTSANLWKRGALKKAGGFDERLQSAQEYDLMFRLLKRGRVLFDDRPLTEKLDRKAGSISSQNKVENRLRFIGLQLRVRDYCRKKAMWDDEFENYFYHKLLYEIRLLHELDGHEAGLVFDEYIPPSFSLKGSEEISAKYVLAYRMLGYRNAQKISRIFKKLSFRLH